MHNIRNGFIQRQISTSIKVIFEHFSLAPDRFRDNRVSKFVILKMYVQVMMYNNRSGTIQWQIYDFLTDGNSNVCIFPVFF